MRSSPLANAVVRTILAVIFGFMSLFHATAMSFAKEDLPARDIAAQHVVQHEDHAAHQHNAKHDQKTTHNMPSCYGVGCFITLDSLVPMSPVASLQPIATLSPALDRTMVAVLLDPAVPPPRF